MYKPPYSNIKAVQEIYESAWAINAHITIFEHSDLYQSYKSETKGWTKEDYEYALRLVIEGINESAGDYMDAAVAAVNAAVKERKAKK